MHPQSAKTRRLAACAVVAALYAALTILTASFSFGPLQLRLAESLCVLPLFAPYLGWGLVVGCLIANLFSTVSALDLIVGPLATALACILLTRRRRPWVAILAPVLCNGALVGAMLSWVNLPADRFWHGLAVFGGEVALSELAVMLLAGLPLLLLLRRTDLLHRLGL